MTESKDNKVNVSNQKECKCCFQHIDTRAKVCNLCGRHQNFWARHFGDTAIIVSIVMVVIAAVQMFGAIKQNIDASSALEKAESAATDANHALAQVLSDVNEINKLKHIIDNQGAQVELVSNMAFKAKNLLDELSSKSRDMEAKLVEYDSAIVKITEILERFQLMNKFMMTVIRAQGDDRKAFDQLGIWAENKTFFLHSDSFQAYATILDEHNVPLFKEPPDMLWKQGVDPSKLNLIGLKHEYENIHWYFKSSLIKYIYGRSDFSKYEKLEFLIEIIKNDSSIRAVEYAGRCLIKETGLKAKTLAISRFIDWWEKNRKDLNSKG